MRFEQYMQGKGYNLTADDGGYMDDRVQYMWLGWQAAMESKEPDMAWPSTSHAKEVAALESKPVKSCDTCKFNDDYRICGAVRIGQSCKSGESWQPITKPESAIDRLQREDYPENYWLRDAIMEIYAMVKEIGK